MARLRQDTTRREELIHEILKQNGELSTDEIATVSQLSYWQVRSILNKLVEDDKIFQSRTQNKKLYFMSKESGSIPSIRTGTGLIPFHKYMNIIMKGEQKPFDAARLLKSIYRAAISSYIQPIIANKKSAIDEKEMAEVSEDLKDTIKRLENLLILLRDLDSRMLNQTVERYQVWYNDPEYDMPLAIESYKNWFEGSYTISIIEGES